MNPVLLGALLRLAQQQTQKSMPLANQPPIYEDTQTVGGLGGGGFDTQSNIDQSIGADQYGQWGQPLAAGGVSPMGGLFGPIGQAQNIGGPPASMGGGQGNGSLPFPLLALALAMQSGLDQNPQPNGPAPIIRRNPVPTPGTTAGLFAGGPRPAPAPVSGPAMPPGMGIHGTTMPFDQLYPLQRGVNRLRNIF